MASRAPRGPGPGGSAGRRPSQSAPSIRRTTRVDAPAPTATSRGSSTFTKRALVLLLVVAVLGVSYASSIRAWLNQRSEQSSLAAQIAAEKAAIAASQTQKARWNDPAYIESMARLRFGWVMPGERSYRVIGKDGKVLSAETSQLPTPLGASSAGSPPWWKGSLDSLKAADADPADTKSTGPRRTPQTLIGPIHGSSGSSGSSGGGSAGG